MPSLSRRCWISRRLVGMDPQMSPMQRQSRSEKTRHRGGSSSCFTTSRRDRRCPEIARQNPLPGSHAAPHTTRRGGFAPRSIPAIRPPHRAATPAIRATAAMLRPAPRRFAPTRSAPAPHRPGRNRCRARPARRCVEQGFDEVHAVDRGGEQRPHAQQHDRQAAAGAGHRGRERHAAQRLADQSDRRQPAPLTPAQGAQSAAQCRARRSQGLRGQSQIGLRAGSANPSHDGIWDSGSVKADREHRRAFTNPESQIPNPPAPIHARPMRRSVI